MNRQPENQNGKALGPPEEKKDSPETHKKQAETLHAEQANGISPLAGAANRPPAAASAAAPGAPALPPGSCYAPGSWPPLTPDFVPSRPAAVKEPFTAGILDGLLAVFSLFMGLFFIRWVVGAQGWGVTLYTFAYAGALFAYGKRKGIHFEKESFFWLAILLLTGISFALWDDSMQFWRFLLLFGSAVYWFGASFGLLCKNKTSNYLVLDAWNLFVKIPFKNFGILPRAFRGFRKEGAPDKAKHTKRNNVLFLLFGLLICIPVLALLLPLLLAADQGYFRILLYNASDFLRKIDAEYWTILVWEMLLGIPVALYLCGLAGGGAHRRYVKTVDAKKAEKNLEGLRILPQITILTVLAVVSALYLVFIGCQLPYFFSAFWGTRPDGYEVYSRYAREGFFELCNVATINLALLLGANFLGRVKRKDSKPLRGMNILLSVLTLLLIVTAMSKMLLYIGAYGLSVRRIQTSVFMAFLFLVFAGVILLQYRPFSMVRFSAVCAAAALCGMCCFCLDSVAVQYNANEYINGNLSNFDAHMLRGSKANAIEIGVELMQNIPEKQEFFPVFLEMESMYEEARAVRGTHRDTLSDWRLRRNWKSFEEAYRERYPAVELPSLSLEVDS